MNPGRILPFFRLIYYKVVYQAFANKARFGRGVRIGCRLRIRGPGRVDIGDQCHILPALFGNGYVTLYTYDPKATITIGRQAVLRGTRMGCYESITVGERSVVEECSIFDSDFHNIDATRRNEGYRVHNRPVVIEKECYVGRESLIGKGVHIGANSSILAGALATGKQIKPNSRIGGLPARALLPSGGSP